MQRSLAARPSFVVGRDGDPAGAARTILHPPRGRPPVILEDDSR
jgi:hypothetical protein